MHNGRDGLHVIRAALMFFWLGASPTGFQCFETERATGSSLLVFFPLFRPLFRSLYFSLARHYLNAWNRLNGITRKCKWSRKDNQTNPENTIGQKLFLLYIKEKKIPSKTAIKWIKNIRSRIMRIGISKIFPRWDPPPSPLPPPKTPTICQSFIARKTYPQPAKNRQNYKFNEVFPKCAEATLQLR